MGVEGSKFNVCVTAGPDAPDMLFRFKIKDGSVTVGQVIDAVTEEIQAGLGDEQYSLSLPLSLPPTQPHAVGGLGKSKTKTTRGWANEEPGAGQW